MDLYGEAFRRNIGLLTEAEQERIRSSKVAIAGLGGVGGIHLATLARIGVGGFHIADNDVFETANLNRQYGATVASMNRKKTDVMAEVARAINPEARVTAFSEGVTEKNVDEFLSGVGLVVDGIDFFSIDIRRLLFNRARERGVYAVTSGPIGFGSTLQIFAPSGMSFDEYFGINDRMSEMEKIAAFAVGLAPRPFHLRYMDLSKVDLAAGTAPSLASACALCAALVATEAVKILLQRGSVKAVPHYFQFDPYRRLCKKGYLFWGAKNPLQYIKRKVLLKRVARLIKRQAPP